MWDGWGGDWLREKPPPLPTQIFNDKLLIYCLYCYLLFCIGKLHRQFTNAYFGEDVAVALQKHTTHGVALCTYSRRHGIVCKPLSSS